MMLPTFYAVYIIYKDLAIVRWLFQLHVVSESAEHNIIMYTELLSSEQSIYI